MGQRGDEFDNEVNMTPYIIIADENADIENSNDIDWYSVLFTILFS